MNRLKHHPPMRAAVKKVWPLRPPSQLFCALPRLAQGETASTSNNSERVYEFETHLNSSYPVRTQQ